MEILIAGVLMGIALFLLFYPIAGAMGYFRTGTAQADAQNVARIALDGMCRELQEAMYVQLDMYESTVVAFIPPLRADPNDPNSEIVTPPRPDWDHAIRYWRALHDPTANYNPGTRVGTPNTYYLARTVVADPFDVWDPWNRWNSDWAADQSANAAEAVPNWAPIPRVVNTDVDNWLPGGTRTVTLQPGYPYLDIRWRTLQGEIPQGQAARPYRDLVVGMTPNALDYDVTSVEFHPLVVSGEWLTPVSGGDGDDYSVYHTRYPLLRLGAPYTGWASFSGGQQTIALPDSVRKWARDPFLLIYRFNITGPVGWYQLRAIACFDPRSRTMRVLSYPEVTQVADWRQAEVYDTGSYPSGVSPAATDAVHVAFGIGLDGWIEGAFQFDFPPPADARVTEYGPVPGSSLALVPMTPGPDVYEWPLLPVVWGARNGGETLGHFLLPDSVQVRVHDWHTLNEDESPERVLTQVSCTPRSGLDQFQVGLNPIIASGWRAEPRYGVIRLPERLADGDLATEHHYRVDFRWRSNGVWSATSGERPDLVCAYYRSAAVLDVSLTVTRADTGARQAERVAQSAHLTRRVKLRNALREITHGSR